MALGETAAGNAPQPTVAGDLLRLPADFVEYQTIADALPQFVWVSRPDGKVEYFNRRWIDYTGVTVADLELNPNGQHNAVHPEDLDETWERWRRALATGEPFEIEYRLRRASDSTYRWFVARAVPVRNGDGRISGWIGSATDIDDQRRASDNLRFVIEATSGLAGHLSVAAVCEKLAELAIHRVADWCFVVLAGQRGAYRVESIAHRDPMLVRYIEQFRDMYPVRGGSTTDIAVRKNVSILTPVITDEDVAAAAEDERHLALMRKLHMHSAMTVPLAGDSGHVYGAIVLISAESARRFTQDDLDVAERVAKRAGTAIETAHEFQQERSRSQRLRFIARASEIVFETLDLQSGFERLCEFIVTEMADLAYIMRFEEEGALRTVAAAHRDPSKRAFAEHLCGERTLKPPAEENAIRMLSQHRTVVHETVDLDEILPHMWEYLAPDVRALAPHSAITVPLFARGETYGALVAYWCETPSHYDGDDIPIFEDLGRRTSIAIEHASAFERERRISVSLQQALLPTDSAIPQRPGVEFAYEYRPSSTEAEVGGDWFDAFSRSDGSIAVCVGDVTGRGLEAAGLMGKLRQSIGIAAMYETDPARILDTVDAHLRSRRAQALATAFVGIIDPEYKSIRYSSAGHPPPLLRRGNKVVELRTTGLPLGLRDLSPGDTQEQLLESGDLLVLYTDGLLEGTRDLVFGERRLREVALSEAVLCVRNPARLLCDACLPRDALDDTAVLTVRFGKRKQWQFDAENAQAANDARKEFVAYLRAQDASDNAVHAAELVFGEMVGNVVRHAPGPIDVQLDTTGPEPVLHVIDRGVGFIRDPALPINPLSESGRGLYIISRLTKGLRVERIPGYGNHIAATLSL